MEPGRTGLRARPRGSPLPALCPSHSILHCDFGAGGFVSVLKRKEQASLLGPGVTPQIQIPCPKASATFLSQSTATVPHTRAKKTLCRRVNFTNSTISEEMEGSGPRASSQTRHPAMRKFRAQGAGARARTRHLTPEAARLWSLWSPLQSLCVPTGVSGEGPEMSRGVVWLPCERQGSSGVE